MKQMSSNSHVYYKKKLITKSQHRLLVLSPSGRRRAACAHRDNRLGDQSWGHICRSFQRGPLHHPRLLLIFIFIIFFFYKYNHIVLRCICTTCACSQASSSQRYTQILLYLLCFPHIVFSFNSQCMQKHDTVI